MSRKTPVLPLALLFAATASLCNAQNVRVTADGNAVHLHSFAQGDFGLFEVAHPTEMAVKVDFNVRWVEVRPLALGIHATIDADHSTVHFTLPSATPVTVEFNDDLARVLHLFPYVPEASVPHPGDPGVHYYGPGVQSAGRIDLKDNETLYLAPGAWVQGYVRSEGTRGVSIRGRGILDGSAIPDLTANNPAASNPTEARANVYSMGARNLVYFHKTTGASIEGVTLFNCPSWTVVLREANGTRVDGVRILNPSTHYGDDGFDIVSSSDVSVVNTFVRTNDDCIVVKNLDDIPTHDISASHCVLWNMPTGGNGLEVGFELGATPVSGVHFRDIDIIHVERGSAISIHQGDAGTVEDVSYDDIRVEDVRRKLVDFTVLYAQYGLDRPATAEERARRIDVGGVWDGEERLSPAEHRGKAAARGRISGVRIHNLAVVGGALPYSVIAGYDADHPVQGVHIDGLTYLGRPLTTPSEAKLVLEFAPGFEMH